MKQRVQLRAGIGIDPVGFLFESMERAQQIRMLRVSGIVAPLLQTLAKCGGVAAEGLQRFLRMRGRFGALDRVA